MWKKTMILLNGPSSAGKSTVSRELQKILQNNGVKSIILSIDDYMITDPKETIYEDDLCIDNGRVSALENAETIINQMQELID